MNNGNGGPPRPPPGGGRQMTQHERDEEMKRQIKRNLNQQQGTQKPPPPRQIQMTQEQKDEEMKRQIRAQLASQNQQQQQPGSAYQADYQQRLPPAAAYQPRAMTQQERDEEMKRQIKQNLNQQQGLQKLPPPRQIQMTQEQKDEEMKRQIRAQLASQNQQQQQPRVAYQPNYQQQQPARAMTQEERDAEMKKQIKQQLNTQNQHQKPPPPTISPPRAMTQEEKDAETKRQIREELNRGSQTQTQNQTAQRALTQEERDAQMKMQIQNELNSTRQRNSMSQTDYNTQPVSQYPYTQARTGTVLTQNDFDNDDDGTAQNNTDSLGTPQRSRRGHRGRRAQQTHDDQQTKERIRRQMEDSQSADLEEELSGINNNNNDEIDRHLAAMSSNEMQFQTVRNSGNESNLSRYDSDQPMKGQIANYPDNNDMDVQHNDDADGSMVPLPPTGEMVEASPAVSVSRGEKAGAPKSQGGIRPGAVEVQGRAYGAVPAWIRENRQAARQQQNAVAASPSSAGAAVTGATGASQLDSHVDDSNLPPELRRPQPQAAVQNNNNDLPPELRVASHAASQQQQQQQQQQQLEQQHRNSSQSDAPAVVAVVDQSQIPPELRGIAPSPETEQHGSASPEELDAVVEYSNARVEHAVVEDTKSGRNKIMLCVIVAIVVIVVGVVVGVVLGGGGDGDESAPSNNQNQGTPTPSPGGIFATCSKQSLPNTSRTPEEIMMRYQEFSDELSTGVRNFVARNIPDDVCDPGHLSVLWLAQSTIELEVPKDVLINRYLLAVIYFTMDGDDWKVNDNWLSDAAVCEWHGVDCDGENNDDEEIITELSLPSNDIGKSITIPEEIGFLSTLRVLDLSDNNMAGTLPSSLFQLRDLYFLRLDDNDVEGNFPFDELSMNTNLRVLALGGSTAKLEGHLSSDIGRLTNLEYFDFQVLDVLGTNVLGLQGSIPSQIGFLSNLASFSIRNSKVEGKIPSEIGHLTKLVILQLLGTEITELVTEMGLLQKLRWLDLSQNIVLQGTLISEIGNLSSLETLNLAASVLLSGSFPTEIGHLTSLRNLDLRNVGMEGIPTEIGQCTSLELWTSSKSCLGGQIPSEIGNLSNLELLEFANSCLTGTVPSEVFGLESLVSLSLREPDLEGAVPKNLSHLSNLACLDLTSDLQGTIPCDFPQFEDGFEFGDVENVQRYVTQLPPKNLDIYFPCQSLVTCGGDCCKLCIVPASSSVRCGAEGNLEAVIKIFNDQITTLQNEVLLNITF